MLIPEQEIRTTVERNICDFHKEHPGEPFAGCTCSTIYAAHALTPGEKNAEGRAAAKPIVEDMKARGFGLHSHNSEWNSLMFIGEGDVDDIVVTIWPKAKEMEIFGLHRMLKVSVTGKLSYPHGRMDFFVGECRKAIKAVKAAV